MRRSNVEWSKLGPHKPRTAGRAGAELGFAFSIPILPQMRKAGKVITAFRLSDGSDQTRLRSQLFYKFNKSIGHLSNAHSNGSNDKSSDNDLDRKAVHGRSSCSCPARPHLPSRDNTSGHTTRLRKTGSRVRDPCRCWRPARRLGPASRAAISLSESQKPTSRLRLVFCR